ncbi:MAG: LPS export ABC transporter permease LptF [Methylibium sp.]|nr:LPS export ABC transporter permease LptF [Methylibium sp.]
MLFDSSVRAELARSFGVTLVVILTIVVTMMLIRTLGQAAGGNIAPQDVVLLMGYLTLAQLPTMLSLSLFVAVVASLSRMYRESEMQIWFASGIGLSRFVKPVLRFAWPVLTVIVVLVLLVQPWGNRSSAQLKERYEKRSDLSRVAPGQFQSSRDGSRVFFIDRDSEDSRTGRNVFILSQNGKSESVTSAHQGQIEWIDGERYLVLENGQRNESSASNGSKTMARFARYQLQVDEQSVRSVDALPPRAMNTLDLIASKQPQHQGQLAWRFGLAVAAVNMVLLGIGMSATNPRRANNWNLLFALLGFVVYFNLINLTQAWVSNGRTSLLQAMLSVHGGAFVIALGLMWLRDQGNRLSLSSWRPRARKGQPA